MTKGLFRMAVKDHHPVPLRDESRSRVVRALLGVEVGCGRHVWLGTEGDPGEDVWRQAPRSQRDCVKRRGKLVLDRLHKGSQVSGFPTGGFLRQDESTLQDPKSPVLFTEKDRVPLRRRQARLELLLLLRL